MITYGKTTVQKLLKSKEPKKKEVETRWCTFWDDGSSINELRKKFPDLFWSKLGEGWYEKESFASLKEEPQERVLCMEPFPGSFNKTWAEQQALLSKDESVSLARQVIMMLVIHYQATGERLFENNYVRCADKGSDGDHVYVGRFGSDGLFVRDRWDGYRGPRVGLASSRKFEN